MRDSTGAFLAATASVAVSLEGGQVPAVDHQCAD